MRSPFPFGFTWFNVGGYIYSIFQLLIVLKWLFSIRNQGSLQDIPTHISQQITPELGILRFHAIYVASLQQRKHEESNLLSIWNISNHHSTEWRRTQYLFPTNDNVPTVLDCHCEELCLSWGYIGDCADNADRIELMFTFEESPHSSVTSQPLFKTKTLIKWKTKYALTADHANDSAAYRAHLLWSSSHRPSRRFRSISKLQLIISIVSLA